MSNRKTISDFPLLDGTPAPQDELLIRDVSAESPKTRKITVEDLLSGATISAATTTAAGKVELATNAETTTGTDATRAVTPAGLGAALTAEASATRTLANKTLAAPTINGASIFGGTIANIADLAIADGGTGASTAAQARTNLGLGTAAVANIGTGVGNVIALDSGGRLPAVDGSQLTNISGGGSGLVGYIHLSSGANLITARDSATAGTIIRVRAGTYTVTNASLAKNGVTWLFEPGAVVNATYNLSSGNRALFDDIDGQIAWSVLGFGQFNIAATTGAESNIEEYAAGACVRIWNGSSCNFEAQSIDVQGRSATYVGSSGAKGIHQRNGTLAVRIHRHIKTTQLAEPVMWHGGKLNLECGEIESANTDAVSFSRTNSASYPKAAVVANVIRGAEQAIRMVWDCSDDLTEVYVLANLVEGRVLTSTHMGNAFKFVVRANTVKGSALCYGSDPGADVVLDFGRHETPLNNLFLQSHTTVSYRAQRLVRTGTQGTLFRLHRGNTTLDGVNMGNIAGNEPAILIPADAGAVALTARNCSATAANLGSSTAVNRAFVITVNSTGIIDDTLVLDLEDGDGPQTITYTQTGSDSEEDIAIWFSNNPPDGYTASRAGNDVTFTATSSGGWVVAPSLSGEISATISSTGYIAPYTRGIIEGHGTNATTVTLRNCDLRVTSGTGVDLSVGASTTITHTLCTGSANTNLPTSSGPGTVTARNPF